jgi:hypothetical protein
MVRGDDIWEECFLEMGLTRAENSDEWHGRSFLASSLPLPEKQWPTTPLTMFLSSIAAVPQKQPVVVFIDDQPGQDDADRRLPIMFWNRLRARGSDGIHHFLVESIPIVHLAQGTGQVRQDLASSPGALIMLGPGAVATRDATLVCTAFCSRGYESLRGLLGENAIKILSALDDSLRGCHCTTCRIVLERHCTKHLKVLKCEDWDSARSEIIAGDHCFMGALPSIAKGGLRLNDDVRFRDDDPSKLGNENVRAWVTLPLGHAHDEQREWLRWPYARSRGVNIFISGLEGLSLGDSYLLLGAMLRLVWLGRQRMWDVAHNLMAVLKAQHRESLMGLLQLAASTPGEQLPPHPPRLSSDRLLGWVAKQLALLAGRKDPGICDTINRVVTAVRGSNADKSKFPAEWTEQEWHRVLISQDLRNRIMLLIQTLAREHEGFSSLLADFEDKYYQI